MSDAAKTSSRKLLLIAAAIVVVGIAVTIVILAGRHSSTPTRESTSTKPGHVKLEFRAMPPSTITLDGVKIGKTPVTVTVPIKTTPVKAVARGKVTRYYRREGKKVIVVEQTLEVVPDHDQTIDFTKLVPLENQPLDEEEQAP